MYFIFFKVNAEKSDLWFLQKLHIYLLTERKIFVWFSLCRILRDIYYWKIIYVLILRFILLTNKAEIDTKINSGRERTLKPLTQINQICVKNAKWHMFCAVSVYRRNNLFRTDGYAQLEPLTNRYNMKSYQRNEKKIYNRLLYHIF